MSTMETEGAAKPAAPIWKSPWLIAAVVVIGFVIVGYLVMRQSPTRANLDMVSPSNAVFKSAAARNAMASSSAYLSPAPPAQPNIPPLPSATERNRFIPPPLSRDGSKAPTLGVTQLADKRIHIAFLALIEGKWGQGAVVLPAAGWGAGPTEIAFKDPATEEVIVTGSGTMTAGQSRAGPMWAMRPTYTVGQGPACLLFVNRNGGADVPLAGAIMCVMDQPCEQAIACAYIR